MEHVHLRKSRKQRNLKLLEQLAYSSKDSYKTYSYLHHKSYIKKLIETNINSYKFKIKRKIMDLKAMYSNIYIQQNCYLHIFLFVVYILYLYWYFKTRVNA